MDIARLPAGFALTRRDRMPCIADGLPNRMGMRHDLAFPDTDETPEGAAGRRQARPDRHLGQILREGTRGWPCGWSKTMREKETPTKANPMPSVSSAEKSFSMQVSIQEREKKKKKEGKKKTNKQDLQQPRPKAFFTGRNAKCEVPRVQAPSKWPRQLLFLSTKQGVDSRAQGRERSPLPRRPAKIHRH
jgi:hypothetical protein